MIRNVVGETSPSHSLIEAFAVGVRGDACVAAEKAGEVGEIVVAERVGYFLDHHRLGGEHQHRLSHLTVDHELGRSSPQLLLEQTYEMVGRHPDVARKVVDHWGVGCRGVDQRNGVTDPDIRGVIFLCRFPDEAP